MMLCDIGADCAVKSGRNFHFLLRRIRYAMFLFTLGVEDMALGGIYTSRIDEIKVHLGYGLQGSSM